MGKSALRAKLSGQPGVDPGTCCSSRSTCVTFIHVFVEAVARLILMLLPLMLPLMLLHTNACRCGKISSAQMEKAMHNLGIDDFVATSSEKVDLNMFIGTARHELDKVALRMPAL